MSHAPMRAAPALSAVAETRRDEPREVIETACATPSGIPDTPSGLEWGILAAIELLVIVMVKSAGLRRGLELMPWPDGLEYAASAVNLAAGRGAVLHFGGYSYPSRYTGGYPLILEFFHRVFGEHLPLLFASLFLGMLSVFGMFMLVRRPFGRAAGSDRGADARALARLHHLFVARDERRAHACA